MTFWQRLFLVFSVFAVMVGGVISLVALQTSAANTQQNFLAVYRALGESLAGGFAESEQTSDVLMQNAAMFFADHASGDGPDGVISQADIEALAKHLQMGSLNVFSATTGQALRSSVLGNMTNPINVFDLCPEYSELQLETRPVVTAFVPDLEGRASKYAMALSSDGRYIVNAGMFATSSSAYLRRATAHDDNIEFIRLLAPNGQVALAFEHENQAPPAASPEPWYGYKMEGDRALFSFVIPAAGGVCCECRQKGLISTDGNYFYRLEMGVSTSPMRHAIREQTIFAVSTFATVVFISLALGCWLLGRMTAGVRTIAATAEKIVARRGWDIKVPYEAMMDDDVKKLAQALNRMLGSLEEQEARNIEMERMRCISDISAKVASDIRAPLAALGVAYSDCPSLPEDRRRLVAGAITRIEDISRGLLAAHGQIRHPQPAGTGSVRLHDITPMVNQVVGEFVSTAGQNMAISSAIDGSVQARVEPIAFACLVSNLLTRFKPHQGADGKLHVTAVHTEHGTRLRIDLNQTLGIDEFSFGRSEGHLDQMHKTIASWGGTLRITTIPGVGGRAEIMLSNGLATPREQVPSNSAPWRSAAPANVKN